MSENEAIDFLNAYENVRYTAENRYHSIHVVILPTNRKQSKEYNGQILNHPTVRGEHSKIQFRLSMKFLTFPYLYLNSQTFQIF